MYPILFHFKFITIGSYGVLLGTAFYVGFLLSEREFKLRGKDPELAYKLLVAAIPSAIIGAKLFSILENFNLFLQDPLGTIFSGSGLTVYGGVIGVLLVFFIIIKKENESFLEIFDMASLALALGYGIGRLGCHASGDGCYGIATSSFFGTAYPNGIFPTSIAVLPTPLMESTLSFLTVAFLLKYRKRDLLAGQLFFTYLIINGLSRFFIEFIRINPKILFGLSEAQIIAVFFVITGIIGIVAIKKKVPQT